MKLETKRFAIEELKATQSEDGTRTIEGYGSIFGNSDSYGDIVMAGAFTRSIASRKPAMLWQHRSDMPIGVWDDVTETKKGLYLKGHILDTQAGNDAYVLAKGGALNGLSIGFTTTKDERDPKKGIRKLLDVELYEVSLVTFPANEKATITNVKSASDDIDSAVGLLTQACALCDSGAAMTPEVCATVCQLMQAAIDLLDDPNEDGTSDGMEGMSADITPRSIEKRLRDAGFNRSQAKKLVSGGFKALADQRDADCAPLAASLTNAINALKGITA